MQATYKRDMNCSYLVLKNENMPDTTVYPIRMLTENQISSFLPFQLQSIDGEALLYYDISGKQSLEMLYERKTYRWEDLGPLRLP